MISGVVAVIGACLSGFAHEHYGGKLIGISCILYLIGGVVYGFEVL